MSSSTAKEVFFRHASFSGTAYEIGRKEAEFTQNSYPEAIDFVFKGNEMIQPVSLEKVKKTIELLNKFALILMMR
jgi:hypothetical protein